MIWILLLGYCATYFRLTPLTFHSFINTTAFRWNLWAQGGILNLYNRDMACIKIYQNITISCSKTILARLDPTNAATWFASPIQLEGSPPHSMDFVKHGTAGRTDLHWTRGQKWSETNRGFASQRFSCTNPSRILKDSLIFPEISSEADATSPSWLFLAASRDAMTAARTSSSLGAMESASWSRNLWSMMAHADPDANVQMCLDAYPAAKRIQEDTRWSKMIHAMIIYHFVKLSSLSSCIM